MILCRYVAKEKLFPAYIKHVTSLEIIENYQPGKNILSSKHDKFVDFFVSHLSHNQMKTKSNLIIQFPIKDRNNFAIIEFDVVYLS